MSARGVIEDALTAYYAGSGNEQADQVVRTLLHNYDHAHRAEVLAEDGQAYDGELVMYRGLVRTLRAVVRDGRSDEKQRAEVQRLLHEHASDDAAARAEAGEG